MNQQTKPSEEELEIALTTVEELKKMESDNDHQDILEDVWRTIVGVYDLEIQFGEFDEGDPNVLGKVLKSINPEDQYYHDEEYVEKVRERGLDWVGLYE